MIIIVLCMGGSKTSVLYRKYSTVVKNYSTVGLSHDVYGFLSFT